MLRWGPASGPKVVVALPLFEEANRTRAFAASICRALEGLGVGSIVPDLPGQGESLVVTERMRLADLRAAFAAVPGGGNVTVRSGALVVGGERPCWMFSPQTGTELLRELKRIGGGALTGERTEVAGNLLSRALLDDLAADTLPGVRSDTITTRFEERDAPQSCPSMDVGLHRGKADRIVRLASDSGAADCKVDGAPLWRRAEPDDDLAFAQILANDIAQWITGCDS